MSAPNNEIMITGRVFFDEGVFFCELNEIHQITHELTLNEVFPEAWRVVTRYFEVCKLVPGLFEKELLRLGVSADERAAQPDIRMTLRLDTSSVSDAQREAELRIPVRL